MFLFPLLFVLYCLYVQNPSWKQELLAVYVNWLFVFRLSSVEKQTNTATTTDSVNFLTQNMGSFTRLFHIHLCLSAKRTYLYAYCSEQAGVPVENSLIFYNLPSEQRFLILVKTSLFTDTIIVIIIILIIVT